MPKRASTFPSFPVPKQCIDMIEALIQEGKQSPCSILIKRLQNARSLRHLQKKILIGLTAEQISSLDSLFLRGKIGKAHLQWKIYKLKFY